eukprot:164855-Chlamydomonas_euryale.AAC.1
MATGGKRQHRCGEMVWTEERGGDEKGGDEGGRDGGEGMRARRVTACASAIVSQRVLRPSSHGVCCSRSLRPP